MYFVIEYCLINCLQIFESREFLLWCLRMFQSFGSCSCGWWSFNSCHISKPIAVHGFLYWSTRELFTAYWTSKYASHLNFSRLYFASDSSLEEDTIFYPGKSMSRRQFKGKCAYFLRLIWFWCRYAATFLHDHGREVYPEIRAAYVDTMNKVVAAGLPGVLPR